MKTKKLNALLFTSIKVLMRNKLIQLRAKFREEAEIELEQLAKKKEEN